MKKEKHPIRLLTLFCAAVLLLGISGITLNAQAAEITASGTCGDNLTWTLNDEGTLIISGTGNMTGVSYGSGPWYSSRSSILSVIIEDGVTSIGEYAFQYCTSLTSITIPDSVTSIGNYALSDCSSLTSITIPDSVTSIGQNAFEGCRLISITIPDSVTSIGSEAFYRCSSLVSIWVDEDNAYYSSDDYGVLFNKDKMKLIQAPSALSGSYSIPDSVTSIGSFAFYNCRGLTSITIGDSVTNIGVRAFDNCTSLTSIIIPDSVTSIDSWAFYNCRGLTSITISDGVTSIGEYAFQYCVGLTSITIPDSVTSIDYLVFGNCVSLTSITIPDSVTRIGECAFQYCTSLSSITIPDSVTSIGNYALSGCTSLTEIIFTGDAPSIGSNAFWHVTLTAFYPADNHTWTESVMQNYGGTITWVAYEATCQHTYETVVTAPTCTEQGYTTYTCTACGDNYVDDHTDALGHSHGEWVISQAPSFTAEGLQEKVCTSCGDTVTEVVSVAVGKVDRWNITLEDDLCVRFYMNISATIESTARVRLYVGETCETYRVSKLEKTEDGMYIAPIRVAAAQMTDYIFVTVLNNGDISQTATYTVRQYADAILSDTTMREYHAVVKEMLNYGAAAQNYFDYEADNLANQGITGTGKAQIPDSTDTEMVVKGSAEGISFYGASLIFRERIAVRFYFYCDGNINQYTFNVADTALSPQLKDGMYYVEFADILPQELDEQIVLSVADAKGNEISVAYSPMNYIVRMNEKGSDALKKLLNALYNYHLAVKAL